MAETYRLELYAAGPYVNCRSEEKVSLSDWGFTDEEWDAMPEHLQSKLLEEWGQEYFWNEGYEYNATVTK